jgi:hypothetical protein
MEIALRLTECKEDKEALKWLVSATMPDDLEWADLYKKAMLQSLENLGDYAKAQEYRLTWFEADLDPVTNLPIAGTGSNFRPEFGASMILNFNKKELIKNVDVSSNLTLFNNYTDSRKENRKNIDVMWNWNILMKVSKYITTSIIGQMVYDDDILVPRKTEAFKDANGIVSYKTTSGKGIQLKNILGVGFSYKF